MLPWAHPNTQPKWHLDWFSHFCTAHSRESQGLPGHVRFPKNCVFAWGDLDPSNTWFHTSPWAHTSPQPKWHLDWFSRFCTAHRRVSLVYNGPPLLPLKIAPSHGGSGPCLIHGSLGPLESWTQTASRLVQPFCRANYCDRQTDRWTDHAIWSVTIGRI